MIPFVDYVYEFLRRLRYFCLNLWRPRDCLVCLMANGSSAYDPGY
jgi:hypothetical protein